MCLGCFWVLQKNKCQVSDNACSSCLKHVETMTAHDSTLWGKLKRMVLESQMRSQMRQLQEISRVHGRVLWSLFHDGAWLRNCFVMNLKQDGALSGMGISAETQWYLAKMDYFTVILCAGGIATSSTNSTIEQLAPLPGTRFWSASCCRWNVSWLLLRRKLGKHMYT